MDLIPENTRAPLAARPVVYAGRFHDRFAGAPLPGGPRVVGDWDVLSTRLDGVLEKASDLVVMDLFSFPFEALEGPRCDAPMILALPRGFDADFLVDVFGRVAFGRLGFFDRVVTGDDALWEKLRRVYGWSEGQRIEVGTGDPVGVAGEVASLLEAEEAEADGGGSIRRRTRLAKATHRAQAAALRPQFAEARGSRDDDVPFAVLEVGAGIGRWAADFDPGVTRFVGADVDGGAVEAARREFPGLRFDTLGGDLKLPHDDEDFDATFSVGLMRRHPTPAKRALISEMWRVTRPGGRLIFLEEFVTGPGPGVYPTPVRKFVELLLETTAGQVVLEHVESLRYPHDDLVRDGLLSLSRLGVPRKW